MKNQTSLLLAGTLALLTSIPAPSAAPSTEKWQDLFDGKTLNGWVQRGGKAGYKVEGGVIVGSTVAKTPNSFLCTAKDYGDFILELEFKVDPKLNSGIQIRSHVYAKPTPLAADPKKTRAAGEVYGYQCEITTADKCASGNFWDEARWTKWLDDLKAKPGACAAFKDGQWNHYRIVAQGDRIRSWVNGVACADFRDAQDATGFIGLQVHSIKAGTGPYQVRWKNIKLRELKAGETVK